MNFAKFKRTPFLQNTTRRLLLIIAVSIALVMKGESASKSVNYDTKSMHQFEPQVQLIEEYTPVETTGFRNSPSQTSIFKNFVNSTGKHLCLRLLACNSIKKRLQYRRFSVKFTKFLWAPFYIEQLQWLLLGFNSCFERGLGQEPTRLSPIHTRFSWKRYLLPRKSRSSYCRCSVKEGPQPIKKSSSTAKFLRTPI